MVFAVLQTQALRGVAATRQIQSSGNQHLLLPFELKGFVRGHPWLLREMYDLWDSTGCVCILLRVCSMLCRPSTPHWLRFRAQNGRRAEVTRQQDFAVITESYAIAAAENL